MSSVVGLLAQSSLFGNLPPDSLTALAMYGRWQTLPAGSVLMRQGEESNCLYVIARGQVRVERERADGGQPMLLAELGPGEVVGEMGLLDGGRRAATVTALEDTEVLRFLYEAVALVMLQYPRAQEAFLPVMTRRLRAANELIERGLRLDQP